MTENEQKVNVSYIVNHKDLKADDFLDLAQRVWPGRRHLLPCFLEHNLGTKSSLRS